MYKIKKLIKELIDFLSPILFYKDMEDFLIMWQSLADQWSIYISDSQWEEFAEEINSVASNKHHIFIEIFEKHF